MSVQALVAMACRLPRQFRRFAAVVASILLLGGCQKELPAGPDDLVEGVVIHEHANFGGDSALLKSDVEDLSAYKGPCEHYESSGTYGSSYTYDWNDCISSIKVAPGWQATVFVNTGFHKDWLDVTADIPDLGQVRGYCDNDSWNDCISSIRVRRR